MRLLHFTQTSKSGNISVEASWRDQMRRPVGLTLVKEPLHTNMLTPLIDGDALAVHGVMSGIAEIAWSQGWRPHGLSATVAATVERFKIPAPGQRS